VVAGAAVVWAVGGHGAVTPRLLSSAHDALSISNSRDGETIFKATNLAPGDSTTGTVTIGNSGTVPAALSLSMADLSDASGPNGGRLSSVLDLRVTDVTAGSDIAVYAGRLDALPATQLLNLSPGDERVYRFVVGLPDRGDALGPGRGDNRYQGASETATYAWTLAGSGGARCGNLLRGRPGGDRLVGTGLGDRILGRSGTDAISARAGSDCVRSGAGADRTHGGRGRDRLHGGQGADILDGGPGEDVLSSGAGNDLIRSRDGRPDVVNCGRGHRDRVLADQRDDVRHCEITTEGPAG
jgi:Ca2+-binding RTX toxin-like protein